MSGPVPGPVRRPTSPDPEPRHADRGRSEDGSGADLDPAPLDVEAYVEAVLTVVEQVPAGRVVTYADVARRVGRGGPRQVGQVMSRYGAAVPWWRVVRADGQPARGLEDTALDLLQSEGTSLRGRRVLLAQARYLP